VQLKHGRCGHEHVVHTTVKATVLENIYVYFTKGNAIADNPVVRCGTTLPSPMAVSKGTTVCIVPHYCWSVLARAQIRNNFDGFR
jgi:hypothetical protein